MCLLLNLYYVRHPSRVRAVIDPCHAPRRCNCCFSGHATLLNAPGRCYCCFQGRVTQLQRSQTLQLLLLGPRSASATLPHAATAASGSTQSSSNAPATLLDAATAAY